MNGALVTIETRENGKYLVKYVLSYGRIVSGQIKITC